MMTPDGPLYDVVDAVAEYRAARIRRDEAIAAAVVVVGTTRTAAAAALSPTRVAQIATETTNH